MASQTTSTRTSILALLDDARQELLASIEGLGEEQMELPLRDGWSVKDILAHVAMWDEMELADLRRAARGHKPALESFDYSFIDQWNHIQFVLRKRFSLNQVLAELAETRRAILDFLDSLEDGCLSTGYIPFGCMHSVRHDQWHAAQMHEWRKKRGI